MDIKEYLQFGNIINLCGGMLKSLTVMLSLSIPSLSLVMTFENIVTVRFGLQTRMTFAVVAVAHLLVVIIALHFVHLQIRVSTGLTLLLHVLQQG